MRSTLIDRTPSAVKYLKSRKTKKNAVSHIDASSKRRIKSYKRPEEASLYRRRLIEEAKEIPAAAFLHTVQDAADGYISQLPRSPNTVYAYKSAFRTHIAPSLGTLSMAALTNDRISQFEAWVESESEGYSAERRGRIYTVFAGLFRHALRNRWLPPDRTWSRPKRIAKITASLRSKEKLAKRLNMPSMAVATMLLNRSEGVLHIIILLAVRCGLRIGEVLALQWGDVDLKECTLKVQATLDEVNWIKTGRVGASKLALALLDPESDPNKKVRKPPKTKKSNRTIILSNKVQSELTKWKALAASQSGIEPEQLDPSSRVVCGPRQWQLTSTQANLLFKKLQCELGLVVATKGPQGGAMSFSGGFTMHDLRHTCVAIWIWKGIKVETIMRMIGHAQKGTTLDVYGYLIEMHDRKQPTWNAGPPTDNKQDDTSFVRNGRVYRA